MTYEIIDYDKKCVIVGYSGAGKSTLLNYFLKEIAKEKLNCVVVDTTSKFSEKKNIRYRGKTKCKHRNKNSVCVKIQNETDLEKIVKGINDKDTIPILLVVDEIDQFTNTYHLMPETSLFFQQGRNYNHGGIFTIRQIGRLNKQILSNAQTLVLFKIYNKNDIDYLTSAIGIDVSDMVYELKPHEFYLLDLTNSVVIGKYILNKNTLESI